MTTPDICGWIGNVGFFVGAIYVARLKKIGWIFQAFGNFMYIIQGVMLGLSSLLFVSIGLIILDLYGYKNWEKKL